MNKLTDNTLACFDYFQKLWEHLLLQLEKHRFEKFRERHELKRICGAVEAIVQGTDARLRGVCSYQKQLHECACKLLHHIEDLVDSMPPSVLVDSTTLVSDPLVRTLFSDDETTQRLLIRNRDIRTYFNAVDHANRDELFALLLLHHKEKTILGTEMRGEMIVREVRQTTFCFYGHRLVGFSASEEAVRTEMMITLFECVLRYIKSQYIELKRDLLKQQNNYLLNHPEENINNPEVYIKLLIQQLNFPKQLVKLTENPVRMSRMGIKLPLDSALSSNLIRLHELQVADDETSLVRMIRYPRDGLSARTLSSATFI
ncbi:MAG: hypothetical protein ABFS45_17070 [Pseudomonadota bacterium]